MFEKISDKLTKTFSKKAVENAKQAVIEDVKENHVAYISVGLIGIVLAVGVVCLTKAVIGATASTTPALTRTVNVTYNYYISTTGAASGGGS